MKTINFSYNWNKKLHNEAFTTIRLHNPTKYQVDEEYLVKLDKSFMARTVKVIEIRTFKLDKLNEFIARLDTGYSHVECEKLIRTMYKNIVVDWPNQKLDLILCSYTQNSAISQTKLL